MTPELYALIALSLCCSHVAAYCWGMLHRREGPAPKPSSHTWAELGTVCAVCVHCGWQIVGWFDTRPTCQQCVARGQGRHGMVPHNEQDGSWL